MTNQSGSEAHFEFTEDGLSKFVQRVRQLEKGSQVRFYVAVCSSSAHSDRDIWVGAKREDRREAIRDAVEHNRQYGHRAGVVAFLDQD